MITPIAFTSLTLPFPVFGSFFTSALYNLLFLPLYGVLLPAAETAFFFKFLPDIIEHKLKDFIVCGAYAGYNWVSFWFILSGFFGQLFFGILTFGIGFGILLYKKSKALSNALSVRLALSFGVIFWLLYLSMTNAGWMGRSSPHYYFKGNLRNIWKSSSPA